jgi:hypothetical protein
LCSSENGKKKFLGGPFPFIVSMRIFMYILDSYLLSNLHFNLAFWGWFLI